MVQSNIVLPLLILTLSIRMLPVFGLTVRLKQLVLFKWLWYYFFLLLWQMGSWNMCINTFLLLIVIMLLILFQKPAKK